MTGVALFDDFTDTVLGHHPDYVVGLANAAATVAAPGPVRMYCPPAYLTHHRLDPAVTHRATTGASPGSGAVKLPYSRAVDPGRLAEACRDAHDHGATVFLNCYFDENYPAWPAPGTGLRFAHSLHRPGYFAADAMRRLGEGGRLADLVRGQAPDALFVVNTAVGERQARQFVDARNLLRAGWPTATRAEVAAAFARGAAPADEEPYVLSIGSARSDKGVRVLLSALAGGPLLRILGQQYDGVEKQLSAEYPHTRVDWESGWISRERLGEVIGRASVIVFPYQQEFAGYGGASGALAQAISAGKPVIVSEVLAEQVPDSPACRVVPAADERALRRAVDDALRHLPELREAAAGLRAYVEENHTYEGHVERVLDRCG
ncbi:glycosyltransferase [Streptomyces abyssomicinicus]|uniref:glycosyltransferase n=1 Tax=Streptomyces abyssomicinicus TaxID=574929 RepID=UPI00124F8E96|nr:glycosyltransferase [Streptomyces abyssomicinicus]